MKIKTGKIKIIIYTCSVLFIASTFIYFHNHHKIYKLSKRYFPINKYIVDAFSGISKTNAVYVDKNDKASLNRNLNYVNSLIFKIKELSDFKNFPNAHIKNNIKSIEKYFLQYKTELKIHFQKGSLNLNQVSKTYHLLIKSFKKLHTSIGLSLYNKRKVQLRLAVVLILVTFPGIIILVITSILYFKSLKKKYFYIKDEYNKYKSLAGAYADIIWETDISGYFTKIEGNTKKILGYDVEELIGKTRHDFMSRSEGVKYLDEYSKAVCNKSAVSSYVNVVFNKNGNFVYFETSFAPVFNFKNEVTGFSGFDKDVTERVKNEIENKILVSELNGLFESNISEKESLNKEISILQSQLEILKKSRLDVESTLHEYKRNIELKEYISAKEEELTANLSTDVKDAVFKIMETVSLFFEIKGFPKESHQDITVIKRSAQKINQVISTFTEAWRLYNGHYAVNIINFKIRSLASFLTAYYKDMLNISSISFNVEYSGNHEISADYDKIKEIIVDVVDEISTNINCRFINLKLCKKNQGILNIEIKQIFDNDPEGLNERAFELSAKLTELLKGTFYIETGKNENIFNINIPIGIYEEAKIMPPLNNKINILFAEDDATNNEYITELLNSFDYLNHSGFLNGEELLKEFKKSYDKIELIILDIQMPVMDGIEALKLIKEIKSDITVFAMTAFAMAGDKYKFLNLGFSEYITKPINHQELEAKIKKYFPNRF